MSYMKPEIQAKLAGADLSALQYTQVKFNGTDKTSVVGAGAGEEAHLCWQSWRNIFFDQ